MSVRLMWVSTEPGERATSQASSMYLGVQCSCVLSMYRRGHVHVSVCAIEVKPRYGRGGRPKDRGRMTMAKAKALTGNAAAINALARGAQWHHQGTPCWLTALTFLPFCT